ncbi:MAG TPA: hypothetical protein DD641_08880 [Deltaproteobacteria bacterium]|nr:hypothetical protein [Deltaproteobacteria bacterium]
MVWHSAQFENFKNSSWVIPPFMFFCWRHYKGIKIKGRLKYGQVQQEVFSIGDRRGVYNLTP